jgi:signal transduction histidine kinase
MNVLVGAEAQRMIPAKEYAEKVKRVLVVEDDPVYASLLERYLLRAFGDVFVVCCDSARGGMTEVTQEDYQIILIDYNLPDRSGYDFLLQLQKDYKSFPPPAIILTAEGGAKAAREALQANAYDFMVKADVNCKSLERSISNALQKHTLQKALYHRACELEISNKSLKKRNREISDFYQTVSHEVKTPLAASREFIALIRDEVLGPINNEQEEILDYALAGCDQIAAHFNDLVEATRLDSAKVKLRKKKASIDVMLKRTEASCARAITEKHANLTISNECSSNLITVDENRIVQVLSNLLSNAVKYSPENSSVTLTAMDGDEAGVIFCVADTGFGIASENKEHIFSRLYQVSSMNCEHSGAGLGLGLSIARELVHLHAGRIWVESELNVGSQFYVELPN